MLVLGQIGNIADNIGRNKVGGLRLPVRSRILPVMLYSIRADSELRKAASARLKSTTSPPVWLTSRL
jgi:hypothetical protein